MVGVLVFILCSALVVLNQAQVAVPRAPARRTNNTPRAPWGSLVKCNMKAIMLDPNTPNPRFKRFTRLDRCTFLKLDKRLAHAPHYSRLYHRDGTPIRGRRRGPQLKSTRQEELLVALYALSSLESYARIAEIWGLSSSTYVVDYVDRFVLAVNTLYDEEIQWPRGKRLQEVMNGFEYISGIRGICGAVDGCHIEISNPGTKENGGDYNSYKKRYTMLLHACVDCDGLFTHVAAGFPGACADTTCLGQSGLAALAKRFCHPESNDPTVPRFLIGDGGYSLHPWLLVGFDYLTTDTSERDLNACLDTARVVVENAFGRLKGRWR